MKKILELKETRQGCAILEKESRYHVMLHGQKVSELYFNMRGYVGALPMPDGSSINIGEVSISRWKREPRPSTVSFSLRRPPKRNSAKTAWRAEACRRVQRNFDPNSAIGESTRDIRSPIGVVRSADNGTRLGYWEWVAALLADDDEPDDAVKVA